MPRSLRLAPKRGLLAALTASALLLAACGADSDTVVESGAEATASTEPGTQAPATTVAEADTPPADSSAAAAPVESTETDVAAENLFPDVEVLSVADGSSINLAAELGGGDLPVLLWFWAPH